MSLRIRTPFNPSGDLAQIRTRHGATRNLNRVFMFFVYLRDLIGRSPVPDPAGNLPVCQAAAGGPGKPPFSRKTSLTNWQSGRAGLSCGALTHPGMGGLGGAHMASQRPDRCCPVRESPAEHSDRIRRMQTRPRQHRRPKGRILKRSVRVQDLCATIRQPAVRPSLPCRPLSGQRQALSQRARVAGMADAQPAFHVQGEAGQKHRAGGQAEASDVPGMRTTGLDVHRNDPLQDLSRPLAGVRPTFCFGSAMRPVLRTGQTG